MSYTKAKSVTVYESDGKWYMRIFGTESNVWPADYRKYEWPRKGEGFATKRDCESFIVGEFYNGMIVGHGKYQDFIRAIRFKVYTSETIDLIERLNRISNKAHGLSGRLWDGKTIYNGLQTESTNYERHLKYYKLHEEALRKHLIDDFYRFMETRNTKTRYMLYFEKEDGKHYVGAVLGKPYERSYRYFLKPGYQFGTEECDEILAAEMCHDFKELKKEIVPGTEYTPPPPPPPQPAIPKKEQTTQLGLPETEKKQTEKTENKENEKMNIEQFQMERLEAYFKKHGAALSVRREEKKLTIKGAYAWIESKLRKAVESGNVQPNENGCVIGDDDWVYAEMMHYFANCEEGDTFKTADEIEKEQHEIEKEKKQRAKETEKKRAEHNDRVNRWQNMTREEIADEIFLAKHAWIKNAAKDDPAKLKQMIDEERARIDAANRKKEEEKRAKAEKETAKAEREAKRIERETKRAEREAKKNAKPMQEQLDLFASFM